MIRFFCRFAKNTSEIKSGIVVTKISDHLPCFSVIKIHEKRNSKPEYVKVNKNGPKGIENFINEVEDRLKNAHFENDLAI